MDEIDAIGGKRFSEGTSADREVRPVVLRLGREQVAVACWTLHFATAARNMAPLLLIPVCLPPRCRQVQRTLMELLSQLDGFEKLGKVGRAGCAFCLLF